MKRFQLESKKIMSFMHYIHVRCHRCKQCPDIVKNETLRLSCLG